MPHVMHRMTAAVVLIVCFLATDARGETFRVTDLGALPGATVRSAAISVNDSGEVVGFAEDESGAWRVFLWLPSANHGLQAGIHDLGLWDRSARWTDTKAAVGAGGRTYVGATRLSPASVRKSSNMPAWRAFSWSELTGLIDLGALAGGEQSGAEDINSLAEVVGWSEAADVSHGAVVRGFRWTPQDGMSSLGTLPGFANSRAAGCNDTGTIVGTVSQSSSARPSPGYYGPGSRRAFLWRSGVMTDLNEYLTPGTGWVLEEATGINEAGQIVGAGVNPAGERRAFLLTPCMADFDCDGVADAGDVAAYLAAYSAGEVSADMNHSGSVESADITAFLSMPVFAAAAATPCDATSMFMVVNRIAVAAAECDECAEWRNTPSKWNTYHPLCNPECYGCDGGTPGNPGRDGRPGWPGDAPGNPYAPNGGPGGDGQDGDDNNPPGSGGNGGNGTEDGDGGAGGSGGDGGQGTNRPGAPGGNGGNGGPEGGDGGDGGAGGEGTIPEPGAPGGMVETGGMEETAAGMTMAMAAPGGTADPAATVGTAATAAMEGTPATAATAAQAAATGGTADKGGMGARVGLNLLGRRAPVVREAMEATAAMAARIAKGATAVTGARAAAARIPVEVEMAGTEGMATGSCRTAATMAKGAPGTLRGIPARRVSRSGARAWRHPRRRHVSP